MGISPVVISVIGFHGGSSPRDILRRKREDIERNGLTYWLHRSWKSKPEAVQAACAMASDPYCLFVAAAGATPENPYGSSRPTIMNEKAREWSANRLDWTKFQEAQSEVSGKVRDGSAHALVFDRLDVVEAEEFVDLSGFMDMRDETPLRFFPNACSICCLETPPGQFVSKRRRLFARGRLCSPFSVWLR